MLKNIATDKKNIMEDLIFMGAVYFTREFLDAILEIGYQLKRNELKYLLNVGECDEIG